MQLSNKKIGLADTTFARIDMAAIAMNILKKQAGVQTFRYTVPGIKDLPVACKRLIEQMHCDIVIAMGMPGRQKIDKLCSHEASLGIAAVQLMTSTHILEVFVHEDEGKTPQELREIAKDRTEKHTFNALSLLEGPFSLQPNAGKGLRQGKPSIGPL